MKLKSAAATLLLSILPAAPGITLDGVLNTTLEKNPAIQQAKSNLEQAAGRRLILRQKYSGSRAARSPNHFSTPRFRHRFGGEMSNF